MKNLATINQLTKLVLQKYTLSGSLTLIAISGAAALGKTNLATALRNNIIDNAKRSVDIFSTDAFLMTRKERRRKGISGYDPRATGVDKIHECIKRLLEGENVSFYPYDHYSGCKMRHPITVEPSDIIIVDGIHSFHSNIRSLMDLRIFLDANHELAINMRSIVDSSQRGYPHTLALSTAHSEHKNYEVYIQPYIEFADIVVQVMDDWKYEIIS